MRYIWDRISKLTRSCMYLQAQELDLHPHQPPQGDSSTIYVYVCVYIYIYIYAVFTVLVFHVHVLVTTSNSCCVVKRGISCSVICNNCTNSYYIIYTHPGIKRCTHWHTQYDSHILCVGCTIHVYTYAQFCVHSETFIIPIHNTLNAVRVCA